MTVKLQIGNRIFDYAIEGTPAGWGEDNSAWAEAVTEALLTVQGPNDILPTSATLINNQGTLSDVAGLVFNTASVLSADIDYVITRTYDSGSTVIGEVGKIQGVYDGTDFSISVDSTNDSGVRFSANAAGQIQYISDDKPDHVSTTIRFRAKTIDRP